LGESVSQRVAYDLRNAFYDKLQRLSFAFHDQQKTGDLMSTATADVENSRNFVNLGLIRAGQLVIMVVGATTLLLLMDWRLALIGLSAAPPASYLAVRMSGSLRRMWLDIQQRTGHLITVLQENLSGVRVVKALGAEEYEEARFASSADALSNKTYATVRLHATNSSLLTLMFVGVSGLVLWYGGQQVLAGHMTAGQLTQFILYLTMLTMPVRMTGWIVNTFSRAVSSGERIFQVLDTRSPVEERPDARDMGRVQGRVRFEGVSFSYRDGAEALHSVEFEAMPGQRIAFLGPPGSGKTTVVHLIPRFYDSIHGRVTIDGADVRDMSLASLRRNVGIVFQDVFLFSATLRENIAYGVPGASREQIEAAAKAAQLHDFIMSLPQGYETWIGERGVNLSGGQRQRLAIARTLLLDPPILVLDDSTSSVDPGTEALIQKALERVMQGRTTFIIAHRLSSVEHADLILVMRDGQIVERGAHRELQRSGGFYQRIYQLQLAPQLKVLAEEMTVREGDS
jgi:ATP-binding cassette subfamily B protein